MENAKIFETEILILADLAKVWDVLFVRFGETALYNPNLEGSHFTTGHPGEIGCSRHCSLGGKTFLEEEITEARPMMGFTFKITRGNMPMVKQMQVEVLLEPIQRNQTKVALLGQYVTSPSFMAGFMRPMMRKKLTDMLIGLKYFLETGHTVSKKTYPPIYRKFKKLPINGSFAG